MKLKLQFQPKYSTLISIFLSFFLALGISTEYLGLFKHTLTLQIFTVLVLAFLLDYFIYSVVYCHFIQAYINCLPRLKIIWGLGALICGLFVRLGLFPIVTHRLFRVQTNPVLEIAWLAADIILLSILSFFITGLIKRHWNNRDGIIQFILKYQISALLIYIFLATALLSPIASNTTLPAAGDLPFHFGLIVQANKALAEGQFPIRVAPDAYYGWRYPIFQFYSQFPYTLAGLIQNRVAPDNPFIAYKLVLWMALVAAGWGIQKSAFRLTKNYPASILAGAIYMAAPYFLINIHARGAFAESIGQGLLPLALYFSLRCYDTPKFRWIVLAGLTWYALATTHNITYFYNGLFMGVLFLGMAIIERNLKGLIRVGLAFLVGILLAAYFLFPILKAEYLNIRLENFPTYAFSYYTPLISLISPVSVPPEPARISNVGMNPAIGWPILFCCGFLFYVMATKFKQYHPPWRKANLIVLMALFLFALFLAWTPFDFWTGLPDVLHFVQFNYRFLTQVMWLGALLSSFGLAQLFLNQLDRRHVLVGIFMIGIASSSYLITHEPLPDIISEQAKRPGIDIPGDYLFDQELLKTELFGKNQMQLVSLENTLVLNKEIQFPNWTAEENPVVSIKGSNINTIPILLSFMINNQEFQSHRFEPGDFTWDIPLKSSAVSGNSFGMKFEIKPFNKDAHFGENPRVKIKTITISGMSPDKTVIPYGILKKNMQNVGEPSNFNITVGNDAHVVQLPALYLPDFISVLVNGKNQAYFGVPHAQYTLVGVRLDPGNYNIQVSFSGLGWANRLSYFSWIALILVSFFVFRRQTIALQTIRNE